MKVNTILGPIDANDLGLTLMHEHIVNIEWNFARAFPGFYDREAVVDMFCAEMEDLKSYGLKTFVDATPITLGRDVRLMQECAERSGINIIACTGLYWQEHPFFHMGVDPNRLAELMIGEIEHGMEGTDSKPGFIKCASQLVTGESENNQNMIRAAAIASKATGLPIYTHADPDSELGRFQKRILTEEGVAPEKIAYGHSCCRPNPDYFCELAKGGSYIGCDQLGYFGLMDPAAQAGSIDLLVGIIGSDLRKQLFLSCDAILHSDFGLALTPIAHDRTQNFMALKDQRKSTLFDTVLPMLRAKGVEESAIQEILVGNPRRYFGSGT